MVKYVKNKTITFLSKFNDETNACRIKITRSKGASLKVDDEGSTQTMLPEVAQISKGRVHVNIKTHNQKQKAV